MSEVDSDKTYDSRTAYDIQPTKSCHERWSGYELRKNIQHCTWWNARWVRGYCQNSQSVKSLIITNLYEEIFDQVFNVSDVKSLRIVGKVSGVDIARFNGMTFPSDRLISDYQANAGITLTGRVCLITPTKTHILNDNFTAACVTYHENTTDLILWLNLWLSIIEWK